MLAENLVTKEKRHTQVPPEEEKKPETHHTELVPPKRLCFILKENCVQLSSDSERGRPIYKVNGNKTVVHLEGMHLCRVSVGEPVQSGPKKVIILFGASGSGISTLIDAMVNYILGVQWKDDFRFKLITDEAKSQAHSQSSSAITAYTIHHMDGSYIDYNLTIIHTPVFGNKFGLKRDNMITKQIKEFFSVASCNGITHLDGVGFVTQPHLTITQQYIFNSILSIFGKDVAKNIFIMVTFSDGQKPPVMTAIEEAKIPHSGFFKFNNSALFAKATEIEDEYISNVVFWKMNVNSFKKFFTEIQKAESVSLTMTKDVLKHRTRLETLHRYLQKHIPETISQLQVLQQERKTMEKCEAEIIANHHFINSVDIAYNETVPLSPGTYAMNCLRCNSTCHYPCTEHDQLSKRFCYAFVDDFCRICDCHQTLHISSTCERFTISHRTEYRTNQDMKQKFERATSEKVSLESQMENRQQKIEQSHCMIHQSMEEAQKCLATLEVIALKLQDTLITHATPVPMHYIQSLIYSEKKQAQEGWEGRVGYLQTTMEQAKMLADLQDIDSIDQRITDITKKKDQGWEEMMEKLEQVKRIRVEVDTIRKERQSKGF